MREYGWGLFHILSASKSPSGYYPPPRTGRHRQPKAACHWQAFVPRRLTKISQCPPAPWPAAGTPGPRTPQPAARSHSRNLSPARISSGRMDTRRLLSEPAAPGPDRTGSARPPGPAAPQPDGRKAGRQEGRTAGRQEGRTPCSSLDPPHLRHMISRPHPDGPPHLRTSGPPDLLHDQQPDARTRCSSTRTDRRQQPRSRPGQTAAACG